MVLMAGCNSFKSPAETLNVAFTALKTNDLKLFKKSLTGAALQKFGNRTAMQMLDSNITRFELSMGTMNEMDYNPYVIDKPSCQHGCSTHAERHYSVEILGHAAPGIVSAPNPRVLMTATMLCTSDANGSPDSISCKISDIEEVPVIGDL